MAVAGLSLCTRTGWCRAAPCTRGGRRVCLLGTDPAAGSCCDSAAVSQRGHTGREVARLHQLHAGRLQQDGDPADPAAAAGRPLVVPLELDRRRRAVGAVRSDGDQRGPGRRHRYPAPSAAAGPLQGAHRGGTRPAQREPGRAAGRVRGRAAARPRAGYVDGDGSGRRGRLQEAAAGRRAAPVGRRAQVEPSQTQVSRPAEAVRDGSQRRHPRLYTGVTRTNRRCNTDRGRFTQSVSHSVSQGNGNVNLYRNIPSGSLRQYMNIHTAPYDSGVGTLTKCPVPGPCIWGHGDQPRPHTQ